MPFGPQYGEFFAWKKFGGGDDLKNEIYGEHNMYSLDCYAIGPETSGWLAGPRLGAVAKEVYDSVSEKFAGQ